MDTQFFQQAFLNWQDRNRESRKYDQLTQAERGEIMRDAQKLKDSAIKPLTIDEVLATHVKGGF